MARVANARRGGSVRLPTIGRVSALLTVVYVTGCGVLTALFWLTGYTPDDVAGPFMMFLSSAAVVLAVRAARHRGLDARTRRGWVFIAVSMVVLLMSYVLFAIDGATDVGPFPIAADWVRQLWPPLLLVGLLSLPTRRPSPEERTKIAYDVGIVVVGGAMLMWHLVVGPVLADGRQSLIVTVAALAYPLFDLMLIFAATLVLFRTAASSTRGPLMLVAAAVTFMVIGDVYLGYLRVQSEEANFGWQFLCWVTACYLIGLAASEQHRAAGGHRLQVESELSLRAVPRLPYLAVTLGYGLLLVVGAGLPLYPYGGLLLGAVAMTGLVIARQITALRENHRLVVTDNLTGLANRALLRDELGRCLRRSGRTGDPVAVLLIDLNRFKEINDTLGHEAGDAMLTAIARLLQRCVRQSGTVARLGGDEFAVLLHQADAATAAPIIADRITEAMRTPVLVGGQPMLPSASIGIALSRPAGDTINDLLHRADTAMYDAKRANGPESAPLTSVNGACSARVEAHTYG